MKPLTASASRFFVRQMLEPSVPNIFPISHNEVSPAVKILSLGVI
jgi:flagellar biosynthesis component FlhA